MLKELSSPIWKRILEEPNCRIHAAKKDNISLNPFIIEDIAKVVWVSHGQCGGDSDLLLGQLKDNRWFFLYAYRCWSDKDNQTEIFIANSFDDILEFGPNRSELYRLSGVSSLKEAKELTFL